MRFRTGIAILSLILVASFGLLALCAFSRLAPAGPNLIAIEPDIQLDDGLVGQSREVIFRVENRSGQSMRILGLGFC